MKYWLELKSRVENAPSSRTELEWALYIARDAVEKITLDRACAELATYRAAIASAESILRGFAMRGQEGDLQAAAEWLEKYGGLK